MISKISFILNFNKTRISRAFHLCVLEGNGDQEGQTSCHGQRYSSCCVPWAPSPQGKFEDAEPLYRRTMELAEATLGNDHPEYPITLSNLVGLLEEQVRATVGCCTLGAYLVDVHALPPWCSIWALMRRVSDTGILRSSAQPWYLNMDSQCVSRIQESVTSSRCPPR